MTQRHDLIIATAMLLGCELTKVKGPHSQLTYWTAQMPDGTQGGISVIKHDICDAYLSHHGVFIDGQCRVTKGGRG